MEIRLGWLASIALVIGGCAAGDECRFGAECASGMCTPGGTCVPVGDRDAGDAPGVDGGPITGTDAGPATGDDGGMMTLVDGGAMDDAGAPDGGAMDDAGPMACHDGDDRLTADELPFPLGESLVRVVATGASVDTTGTTRMDGTRQWDFEGPYAGDANRTFVRRDPSGQWFASSFPGATYVLELSAEDDLLGVFEATSDAVRLLGVVSPTDGLTRTELTYDPPVSVWRFPLEEGASWDETSTVSGLASGVTSVYSERWRVSVDARGTAGTPAGVRDVWRVNTRITRTVGVSVTELRRHAYVEPCVGSVAQIFATGSAAEPTSASEIWRMAP